MPDTPTKLQRWLDLVAYLSSRRLPVAVDEIWGNVPAYAAGLEGDEKAKQSVRRMFERDKDELREVGIPIETVRYSINYGREEASGYRLQRRDFHLPYLKLVGESRSGPGSGGRAGSSRSDVFEVTADEAGAALAGLQELADVPGFPFAAQARSAFRKLSFDLDPRLVSEPSVVYLEDPEAAGVRETVHLLSGAVQRRKTVEFGYHGITRDTVERRSVRPYGLLFQHGRWYLVGFDLGRDDLRMYRVGRIRDAALVSPGSKTPEYDIPDDFDLGAYAGRSAWELGPSDAAPTTAEVRFRFPRSLWAERNGHGALVEESDDGAQLRRFEVSRVDPFLRWVLSLAGDATVEAPASLREAFRALAREVLERHSTPEGEP